MHKVYFGWMCRFLGVALLLLGTACGVPEDSVAPSRLLTDGWSIRAAAEVAEGGAAVSTTGFDASGWYASSVPATPMAALVANGLYPDLYLGTNLEEVDTSQFKGAWWYRTEFEVSAEDAEKVARLDFAGINYAADIWLNGEQLAAQNMVVGAFRVQELDVSGRLSVGRNTLAVAVHPPQPGDFTIGFVDWNPHPPDENMGIWRPVSLLLTDAVSLNDVAVQTEVDLETLESAKITVSAVVRNHSDAEVKTKVSGRIEGLKFAADVILAPYESQLVRFTPDDYDSLSVDAPRLWWPHTLGEPNLYSLTMTAEIDGQTSAKRC
jgi:exo-1,4-beta-D-glucosaminidase